MARGGVRRFGSMSAFTGHRSGGSGLFVGDWKEKKNFNSFMHQKELPIALWRHSVPMIEIRDDKQTKKPVKKVWSKRLVCYETEAVLDGQFFREEKGNPLSPRKHPPKRCGLCKLVEWCFTQAHLYESTRKKKEKFRKGLSFTTPMFKFVGDEDSRTLHVGGICNMFKPEKLNDKQKEEFQEAGLRYDEGWMQNAWAKCDYAFIIVNGDAPDNGLQIAVEGAGLGQAVMKVINDQLEIGRDIQNTPYCIQWKYDEHAKNFNDKYRAVYNDTLKPTPRVLKLIRGAIPDEINNAIDKMGERFNQQTVRSMLERNCILPKEQQPPWDELFPSKEQSAKWEAEDEEEEAAEAEAAADEEEEEEEEDEEEEFECDTEDCDGIVKATDTKCKKCGREYEAVKDASSTDVGGDDDEEEEEEEEEAEKPKKKKVTAKSSSKEEKPSTKKKVKKKSSSKKDAGQGADIPF